eukprot:3092064-Rhodomonas_salina.2
MARSLDCNWILAWHCSRSALMRSPPFPMISPHACAGITTVIVIDCNIPHQHRCKPHANMRQSLPRRQMMQHRPQPRKHLRPSQGCAPEGPAWQAPRRRGARL